MGAASMVVTHKKRFRLSLYENPKPNCALGQIARYGKCGLGDILSAPWQLPGGDPFVCLARHGAHVAAADLAPPQCWV